MEFSDNELVAEARGGSHVAFDRIMRRYQLLVFKIALGVTGERESALDVTQNAFLKVHRNLGTFRTDSNLKNWIARIATNESINWQRSHMRHLADELNEETAVGSKPVQEERLREMELWEQVKSSLATLNPRHRIVVSLRYFEGLSIRDIGAVMGCSEGVVKSILFRSIKKMRIHAKASVEVPS